MRWLAPSAKACCAPPSQEGRTRAEAGSPTTEPNAERVTKPTTTAVAQTVWASLERAPAPLTINGASRERKDRSNSAAPGDGARERTKGVLHRGAALPRSPRLGPTPRRGEAPSHYPEPKLTDPAGQG